MSYECSSPPTHSSWHLDLTKVTRGKKVFDSKVDQEKYCLEMLGRAFTKALSEGGTVDSRDWKADLGKYKSYPYLEDFVEIFGIDTADEKDGEGAEEIMELWRCAESQRRIRSCDIEMSVEDKRAFRSLKKWQY